MEQLWEDFSKSLAGWKITGKYIFSTHSISTDTKKTARKIDASLNEINFIIHEISHKIDHCKNGFILDEYLKSGKKLLATVEKAQSSYAQDRIQNVSSQELEHSALYDRIAEMRNRIGKKANLPLYTIFSNNAIKNVCLRLPQSKEDLLKVKGFGKIKVSKYGDEVIELVRKYCLENKLERVLQTAL